MLEEAEAVLGALGLLTAVEGVLREELDWKMEAEAEVVQAVRQMCSLCETLEEAAEVFQQPDLLLMTVLIMALAGAFSGVPVDWALSVQNLLTVE